MTTPSVTTALDAPWTLPYKGHVGMACLIAAESAIFTIFVVAYLFYIGKSLSGPTPGEVLVVPDPGSRRHLPGRNGPRMAAPH